MRTINESFIVDGSGLYCKVSREVKILGMVLDTGTWEMFKEESPEDLPYGELQVKFDPSTWNREDGIIYTDKHWLADLKDFLVRAGYNVDDIGYSEAGMQGDDYVSLDVGHRFINSWKAIYAPSL